MAESTHDKVMRYRKEFPQTDGIWYRTITANYICSSCKNIIKLDTIYVSIKGLYTCEHCVLGNNAPSSPKQVEQTKQPTPTPPKPVAATWIINSKGICYHCNVNDCKHAKKEIG